MSKQTRERNRVQAEMVHDAMMLGIIFGTITTTVILSILIFILWTQV